MRPTNASLPPENPADWQAMAEIGRVRLQQRKDGRDRHFLDFSPYLKGNARYLTSDRGHRFEGQAFALDHLAQMIQAQADTLAFQDVFRMVALVFIVALIPAWVLGRSRTRTTLA